MQSGEARRVDDPDAHLSHHKHGCVSRDGYPVLLQKRNHGELHQGEQERIRLQCGEQPEPGSEREPPSDPCIGV